MKTRLSLGAKLAIGLGLLLAVLLQLLPFYITVTTSLKAKSDLSSQWLFPFGDWYLQNFATAVQQGHILRAIGNSALVTVVSTVLVCVIGALAAYPLARRATIGNRLVLAGIVGLIMVPPLSILVPLYSMLVQMKGVNTYWGTILVMTAMQLPLAIFLYTAFMRGLPISIEEAAAVDGANAVQVLFRIVFPMLKPVTATVVILTSVAVWNEYALSVFLMRSPELRTIAPAIGTFFATSSSDLGAAAAASLISVLPVLVVYLVLQRYFIKGMVAGSEK
ncbi:carbohydrate ABC transporter permease [Microbacterium bovistercoris]|uniref:Carbohydrate ABC transporter permease n=1 Tax=Microbacterium bovistercoris TaxID=2293570 RepID=A0A371NR23_9MICO|nr:carbohydrate ABC transporter permease [Microbacterium bovistercoris]REJ04085.1 carbohydrate ABC transporter permease [Microbacterium bovistercoris]